MAIQALITGHIFRSPEQRTAKSGNPYVAATIKAKDGEAVQWFKVVAFSETVQAELMRLIDGDALAVQGAFKAETYEKDGVTKVSLSMIADHVLALRQPRKSESPQYSLLSPTQPASPVTFDDALSF